VAHVALLALSGRSKNIAKLQERLCILLTGKSIFEVHHFVGDYLFLSLEHPKLKFQICILFQQYKIREKKSNENRTDILFILFFIKLKHLNQKVFLP